MFFKINANITRVLSLVTLGILIWWQVGYLGGYSFTPTETDTPGTNDTGKLFNLHPLLMVIAFLLLMLEAITTYKEPIIPLEDKEPKKKLHIGLNFAAVIIGITGVVFAFLSHTLKTPDPIPNLYSLHSYLGIFAISFATLQLILGFIFFGLNIVSDSKKKVFMMYHQPLGGAAALLGAAAILTGLQEKMGFMYGADKYVIVTVLPAVIGLLVSITYIFGMAPLAPGADMLDKMGDFSEDVGGMVGDATDDLRDRLL